MSLMKREAGASWDPFRELEEMSTRLNRMFSRHGVSDEALSLKGFDFTPAVRVTETPTHYMVKADLPGVKKEDVKVTIDKGVLTLSGERKTEHEQKDERTHRVETSYGSFMRRMSLPADASPEGVEATQREGVLTVKIAKQPEKRAETKSIPIS